MDNVPVRLQDQQESNTDGTDLLINYISRGGYDLFGICLSVGRSVLLTTSCKAANWIT